MKNLKKLLCGALSLSLVLALAACGGQTNGEENTDDTASGDVPIIGISQYGEHGSLDNCREGFLQGLQEAGLEEGVDYKVDYQNASFDDNMAIQIAQAFSAEDAALMVGIATPSATACYAAAEDKDIPVIFTAITDPVGAKLDSGNITGTSDVLPVEGQLQLIRALQPTPTPSASSTPPASPTPSTPLASMRSWLRTMALPLSPSVSPPSLRSPRLWIPSLPRAWTACPT